MNDYDAFDQTDGGGAIGASSVFIMFDTLIRLANNGADAATIASLELKSTVQGKSVEKVFLSDQAAAAELSAAMAA